MSGLFTSVAQSDYYWLILIAANVPVFFLAGYVFFDSWMGLFKSIFYLFKPNTLSLFDGEFHEDNFQTAKFWGYILTCIVLVISEHAYLQSNFG